MGQGVGDRKCLIGLRVTREISGKTGEKKSATNMRRSYTLQDRIDILSQTINLSQPNQVA